MVRLKGPMFSNAASGSFAKVLNFSVNKGVAYARKKPSPKNPNTAPQEASRAALTFLSQQWSSLFPSERDSWGAFPSKPHVPNYNRYLTLNLRLIDTDQGPITLYPYVGGPSILFNPTAVITPATKTLQLAITQGFVPPTWGWMCFRSTTTGFSVTPDTIVALVPYAGVTTTHDDTDLTPGTTYYYRFRGFHRNGFLGVISPEYSGTPF